MVMRMPGGQRRARGRRAPRRRPASASRMFAPICCEMLIEMASRPLPVTSSVRSGEPGHDRAESRHADGGAVLDQHRRVGDLVGGLSRARTRATRCCWPDCANRPTGSSWFCALQRVGDVVDRQAGGVQPRGIEDDFDLARVAGQHLDAGRRRARAPAPGCIDVDARSRSGPASAAVPVMLRMKIGKTAGVSRSTVSSVSAGSSPRDLGDAVLHLLQRHDHVGRRIELRRDLGGAADAARAHAADAGHFHHRLLDRPRDGRASSTAAAACRSCAMIDDARELERRIDAARQRGGAMAAGDDERDGMRRGRARMPKRRRGDVHSAARPRRRLAAPSGRPAWPA